MPNSAPEPRHKPPLKHPGEKFSSYWRRLTAEQVVCLHAATVWLNLTPQSFFNDYLREVPPSDSR
jgi:hypothetical protein